MAKTSDSAVVGALLEKYGRSYAEEAGIRLADKPAPLYQLLVLATLLSARISGEIAVAAARELFEAGYGTPTAMRKASWQDRVDALGRGHYRRYDERTATMLGEAAGLLERRWNGDLRELHQEARGDARRAAELLTEFPGIGPTGADIFLREAQTVWPDLAPYFDSKALAGAEKIGLPRKPESLAQAAGSQEKLAALASALVRVSRSSRAADEVAAAAKG